MVGIRPIREVNWPSYAEGNMGPDESIRFVDKIPSATDLETRDISASLGLEKLYKPKTVVGHFCILLCPTHFICQRR